MPAPGRLEIQRTADAEGIVLALRGELDLASAPELKRELEHIELIDHGRLLIDLSDLQFMDCTGLTLLISAQKSAQTHGHRLALRRGLRQVQRLFELAGMRDGLTFEE
jgi:anti-sigma B factor antagonist